MHVLAQAVRFNGARGRPSGDECVEVRAGGSAEPGGTGTQGDAATHARALLCVELVALTASASSSARTLQGSCSSCLQGRVAG